MNKNHNNLEKIIFVLAILFLVSSLLLGGLSYLYPHSSASFFFFFTILVFLFLTCFFDGLMVVRAILREKFNWVAILLVFGVVSIVLSFIFYFIDKKDKSSKETPLGKKWSTFFFYFLLSIFIPFAIFGVLIFITFVVTEIR